MNTPRAISLFLRVVALPLWVLLLVADALVWITVRPGVGESAIRPTKRVAWPREPPWACF